MDVHRVRILIPGIPIFWRIVLLQQSLIFRMCFLALLVIGTFGLGLPGYGSESSQEDTCIFLSNGRFRVEMDYFKQGVRMPAYVVSLENETGFDETAYFWFEDEQKIEMTVRLFNGCRFNSYFWFFYAALTKIDFEIRVTDTQTGEVKVYEDLVIGQNPPIQDTEAFRSCDGEPPASPEVSQYSASKMDQELNLINSRFKAAIDFSIPNIGSGKGNVGLATDYSGAFWFRDSSDLNVYIKIIDGRAINGHYWLYYTSLTGAEYSLKVTDTETGKLKTYKNPLGTSTYGVDMYFSACEGSNLIFPWISNSQRFRSILVLNNRNCLPIFITLKATRFGGESQTVNREIPPGGFLEESTADLFPELGDGPGYVVQVRSDRAGLHGRWVTNNRDTASMASPSQGVAVSIPSDITKPLAPNALVGSAMLFGYLPVFPGFFSAPVIVNVGEAPTDVTLYFYDKQGRRIDSATQTIIGLQPCFPFALVVGTILSGLNASVSMVAVSSSEPITGVSFVFNQFGEPALGNATAIDYAP